MTDDNLSDTQPNALKEEIDAINNARKPLLETEKLFDKIAQSVDKQPSAIKTVQCPKCKIIYCEDNSECPQCKHLDNLKGGYCARCETVWCEPESCECVGINSNERLIQSMSIEEMSKFAGNSVFAKEIWNKAIEAAAIHMTKTCWNGRTYADVIRSLKK